MIRKLWEAGTVPSMDYIKAKYDRDAARLTLEKANLIQERQAFLVEQYRLICDGKESGNMQERLQGIKKAYIRYRQLIAILWLRELRLPQQTWSLTANI